MKMGILKKLFGRKKAPSNLFDKAPYLSPWYFEDANPMLTKNDTLLKWKWIEKIGQEYVGALLLVDEKGSCFGIVKTYTYLLPNSTHNEFLVWSRTNPKTVGYPEIKISLYSTNVLQSIENSDDLVLEFKDIETKFFHFNGEPKRAISCMLNPDVEYINYDFPVEFKSFSDFCTVTDIPELYKDGNKQWNNTSIILLKPNDNTIFNYPQDWFNMSDADFGYQWITRAIIDPGTGLIHGQGIRIGDFILNETNGQRR
jgi:hypothetical protein